MSDKSNKAKEELKNLSAQELQTRAEDLRRARFVLNLNAKTAHVKDSSQFKKIRRTIARVLTYLHQKQG